MTLRVFVFALLAAVSLVACSTVEREGAPVRRSLTQFDRHIIDSHEQLYGASCIPSSVEMVLKLLGRVPASYYELQNAWREKKDGNFINFDGKTFAGIAFRQQFSLPRNRKFPLKQLFDTIHRELEGGRFVIVSLASEAGWHNWVIYDEDATGEFLAVSKAGAKTIDAHRVKRVIRRMKGTDIGTYQVLPSDTGREKPNKSPEPTPTAVTPRA